jgi:hypothetical protein
VEELRAAEAVGRNENRRLQAALQQSLIGLEECQKRWTNTDKVGPGRKLNRESDRDRTFRAHKEAPGFRPGSCKGDASACIRGHQAFAGPCRKCSKHRRIACCSRNEGLNVNYICQALGQGARSAEQRKG